MALIETARTRNVLVCGYYGEHNLGDDALLEVLLTSCLPIGRRWSPPMTGSLSCRT